MKIKGVAELDRALKEGHKLLQFGDANKILIVPKNMWAMKSITRHFSDEEFKYLKKKYNLKKFYPYGGK
jgi:hypothetical protein